MSTKIEKRKLNIESIILHHQTIGDVDNTVLKMSYVLSYQYTVITCCCVIFGALIITGATIGIVRGIKRCADIKIRRQEEIQQIERDANERKEILRLLDGTFPVVNYTNIHQGNMDTTCIECNKEFNPNSEVRNLRCQHILHKNCIDQIVGRKKQNAQCPSCKANIFN